MTNSNELKKRKFVHPLWTHLPGLAALIALIAYLVYSQPLPAHAPVHFGLNGQPNGYGSPWSVVGTSLGLSVLFIVISVIIDELWARQEKKKSFNWLCWLDGLVVGWMAGVSIDYLYFLKSGAAAYALHWSLIGAITGSAALLGLIIEGFRPYHPYKEKPVTHDTQYTEAELSRQLKDNAAFIYWDNQNPLWVMLAAVLLPLIFIASTIAVWAAEGLVLFVIIFLIISILITISMVVFVYGGQRILVTRQELNVRWGLGGVKVLHLNTANISDVSLMEFAPLRDFGGYGIRYGKAMTAYFLRGNRGVKITAMNDKKYLVGSDYPERLMAVLQLVTGRK